ncbi:MAG TPA: hypothetical protein DDW17_02200 [Deltaproteobacteria bacterium]|nr:hypothetical protein [Deltaproteobacteria bacterium]
MLKLSGSKLQLDGFECEKGIVSAQEIDLSLYQGQMVRIYLDNDLKLVVNPMYDCYWHLCEMEIPYPKADININEKSGEEIRSEPEPLDLNKIKIRYFDLPKEA